MAGIGSFGTYVAPEKTNKYVDTFAEFARVAQDNPDASWTVEINAADETKERLLIAEAAHKVNKTARLRTRDDSARTVVGQKEKSGNPIYQGTVKLTFTLSEKHKPRRGKDAEVEAEPKAKGK